jgi:CO dehydrogenase/acetyl-CoA synthase epsilon subunit
MYAKKIPFQVESSMYLHKIGKHLKHLTTIEELYICHNLISFTTMRKKEKFLFVNSP